MARIVIETNRLILSEWDRDLAELLELHCNTDEVLKELGGRKSPQQHDELVRWLIDDQQEWFGITYWALQAKQVSEKFPGEFLGFCGLVRADEEDATVLGSIEIGWRLRSDAHGNSFAKEAAIACLQLAFDELRALRVVSRTTLANRSSWGLMLSLGMRHDSRLDYVTGDGDNMIVHVMTYKDWKTAKPKLRNVGMNLRRKIRIWG